MKNISPTKIKILTSIAESLETVDAQLESMFWQWSKDNPGINVTQFERTTITLSVNGHGNIMNKPVQGSVTIMYDVMHEPELVGEFVRDCDILMKAWSDFVIQQNASGKDNITLLNELDMRIALSQPLIKLLDSWKRLRRF